MPYFHGQPLSTSASRIGFAATIAIVAGITGLMLGNTATPKLALAAQAAPVSADMTAVRAAYAKGRKEGWQAGWDEAASNSHKLGETISNGIIDGGDRFCQMAYGAHTQSDFNFMIDQQCIAYRQGRNELRL